MKINAAESGSVESLEQSVAYFPENSGSTELTKDTLNRLIERQKRDNAELTKDTKEQKIPSGSYGHKNKVKKWKHIDLAIQDVYDRIYEEGYYPHIFHQSETQISIVAICRHGHGSDYFNDGSSIDIIHPNPNSKFWKWDDSCSGYYGDFDTCDVCCPYYDDEGNVVDGPVCCPKCGARVPELDEETAIQFFKEDKRILYDTTCPKCGSNWLIPIEEVS